MHLHSMMESHLRSRNCMMSAIRHDRRRSVQLFNGPCCFTRLAPFAVLLMTYLYDNETIRDRIATKRQNLTIFQKIMRRGLLRSLELLGTVAANIRLEGTMMQHSRPA